MDREEVISVSSFLHDLKQPLAHLGCPLAPWHLETAVPCSPPLPAAPRKVWDWREHVAGAQKPLFLTSPLGSQ